MASTSPSPIDYSNINFLPPLSSTTFIVINLALIPLLIYAFTYKAEAKKPYPEPPNAHGLIPYLSTFVARIRDGHAFWWDVARQHPHLAVFTVPGPTRSTKSYVVTTPYLVQQLRRHANKSLEPNPFVKFAAQHFVDVSPEALAQFDAGRPDGRSGLTAELIRADDKGLLGKEGLKELNVNFTREIAAASIPSEMLGSPTSLLEIVKTVLGKATLTAIWGADSPFSHDDDVLTALETFGTNHASLFAPYPSTTARTATTARDKVVTAFTRYFTHGPAASHGAQVSRDKHAAGQRYGLSETDIAKLETQFAWSAIVNTSSMIFWALLSVIRDERVLAELRAELTAASTSTSKPGSNSNTLTLDFTLLRTACPLLQSIYLETLRYHSTQANMITLATDATVTSPPIRPGGPIRTYRLKAGTDVWIPVAMLNRHVEHWGADADELDLRRFVPKTAEQAKNTDGKDGKDPMQMDTSAFQSLGGIPYYCPGRHWANTIVCTSLAALVLRYDFVNGTGEGEIAVPEHDRTGAGMVGRPGEVVEVLVRVRDGWKGRGVAFEGVDEGRFKSPVK